MKFRNRSAVKQITLCILSALTARAVTAAEVLPAGSSISDGVQLTEQQKRVLSGEIREQQEFLERQNFVAREYGNYQLEIYALRKLELIKGTNSPSYRLHLIRSMLRNGKTPRREIEELAGRLCTDTPETFECRQAKAILEVYSREMRMKLQAFNMHETNSDYENAVKDIDEIFGGAPAEEGLRFRYYSLMGNIDGRQQEAIAGLKEMKKQDPENIYLSRQIDELVAAYTASGYAYEGLKNIHDPSKKQLAAKYLQQAIRLQPESGKAVYWKKRLTELKYWNLVDQADDLASRGACARAAGLYAKAAEAYPSSPYSYVGAARCAVKLNDARMYRRYAQLAVKYASTESPQEAKRIRNTIMSLKGDLLMQEAKEASARGDEALAEKLTVEALGYNRDNPWPLYSLAGLKAQKEGFEAGNAVFRKSGANLKNPQFTYPYALFLNEYGHHSEAMQILGGCRSSDCKTLARKIGLELAAERHLDAALKYDKDGNHEAAIAERKAAVAARGNDPWIFYDIATGYRKLGRNSDAAATFEKLPAGILHTAEYAYPYSLLLSSMDEPQQAYEVLKPYEHRDESIDRALERYSSEAVVSEARRLYAGGRGDRSRAVTLLEQQMKDHPSLAAELANLYFEDGSYIQAAELYETAVRNVREEQIPAGRLIRLAECRLALGQKKQAAQIIDTLTDLYLGDREKQADPDISLSLGELDSLAGLCRRIGNRSCEEQAYEQGLELAGQPGNESEILFLRNYARAAASSGKPVNTYLEQLKKAWAAVEAVPYSADDDEFTATVRTRNSYRYLNENGTAQEAAPVSSFNDPLAAEPWLHSSVKKDLITAYRRKNHTVTAAVRYLRDPGHSGYSDQKAQNYILRYSTGLGSGDFILQTDVIHMDVGPLRGGAWNDLYGTCFSTGCTGQNTGRTTRATAALAWQNKEFYFDIGTAPKVGSNGSISMNDIAGAFTYTPDLEGFGFSVGIYRRAMNNSFLSFFGDLDPGTGRGFGAVKRNGVKLTASYPFSQSDGLWGNARYEILRGRNVENNSDWRLMAGYYNHIIDLPNRIVTIGPSVTWMSYKRDLGGYTLGQGGYYSPQKYLSVSLALTWKERTDNWSWLLQGGISETYSSSDPSARYPIRSLIPQNLADRDSIKSGSSDWSFGASIRGVVERRLTSNLVIGAEFRFEKSEEYSPNSAMLYFRWTFDDWNGDLPLPPDPPAAFAEW